MTVAVLLPVVGAVLASACALLDLARFVRDIRPGRSVFLRLAVWQVIAVIAWVTVVTVQPRG